ncbi:MAG: hypothetical protein ACREA0_31050 [bacterium]
MGVCFCGSFTDTEYESATAHPFPRRPLCETCSYPLDTNGLIDRVERDLERLSEVVSFSPAWEFWKPGISSRAECREVFDRVRRQHEQSFVLPRYEDESVIVISIMDEWLAFNFGTAGMTKAEIEKRLGGTRRPR